MAKIGDLKVVISASTSRLRTKLASASSLIRDWSILSTGLTRGISTAFSNVASIGIKAVTIGIAGLVGSFGLAATAGANFEDNILRAFTIMKEGAAGGSASLEALRDKALQLGQDTLFSANSAAEGLQRMARAGFSTREAIESIGPATALAVAGGLSLQSATDGIISSLAGFNLGTKDAGRAADVLALGAASANTTVELLKSSLSFVAPVSAAAGISLEETTAAIGQLANAGIRGSRAGTTLRRAMNIMLAPTGRAKKIFDELGLTFVNSRGQIDSFSGAIGKLNKANLSAAQITTIFGRIAGPGMFKLLSVGSSGLDKLTGKLNNAKGAAERMSQVFRTDVKGRVKDLGATIEGLGLAFSQRFEKPLAKAIFAVRNFIKSNTEASKKAKLFRGVIDGFRNAFSPVTNLIKNLADKFTEFIKSLTEQDVLDFFDKIKVKVQGFIDAITDAGNIKVFKETLSGLVGIIKDIGVGVVVIVQKWKELPEKLQVFTAISGVIIAITGGLTNVVILLITLIALVSGVLSPALLGIVSIVAAVGFGVWLSQLEPVQIAIARIALELKLALTTLSLFAEQAGKISLQGIAEGIINPGARDKRIDKLKKEREIGISDREKVGDRVRSQREKKSLESKNKSNFGINFNLGKLSKSVIAQDGPLSKKDKARRKRENSKSAAFFNVEDTDDNLPEGFSRSDSGTISNITKQKGEEINKGIDELLKNFTFTVNTINQKMKEANNSVTALSSQAGKPAKDRINKTSIGSGQIGR